ncbi:MULTISPECIES: sigma-70 family RNA polymerase sigma factor [unclassified Rathayibacter]|uniref:sigma-70 family RNA polymerase sigma factor n=1 Tax=unclassified Rathayibacter TaxID=2609250 RepID=UPI00188CC473|nr:MULTISPECIES: sigma-70 family RNA polymerase sigma factor [unclassified Rathayibacter]MBF4463214.1 sigma-70 family RNA polymerase sigma factor [Rathayibacter sp. VKM Ac-2879]MBF4504549.1 sigma-70 family RNA polymerase sigma factor [Rathayibacter sp. VKM Ac-2878]
MPAPLADPDRFAALASAVSDPIRRYLWRRTDPVIADDVLAATLDVLRRQGAPGPEPITASLAAARGQLQEARRMQRRQVMLAQPVAVVDPPRLPLAEDAARGLERVRLALSRTPEPVAEPLRLWAWEGLAPDGIAAVLGISEEAAATRLERGQRSLAEEAGAGLGGSGADEGLLAELRDLLRAIDPVAALPPLTADELAALIAGEHERATLPRRRSPWLIAGVGALSAGAAASLLLPFALGVGVGSSSALQLPAVAGAACSPVSASVLAPAQLAFRAEVRSIDAGTVTLQVLDRFVGDVEDSVTVRQTQQPAVDGAPIVFESGVDYLIAANDDVIVTCGLSGQSSPELMQLYREAFGPR